METTFDALFERHRREIHVHCYRMLGSFDGAEDAVQEAFLRSWRARESFDGELNFRAWMYKIATNCCLDALRREKRRAASGSGSPSEIPWLTPYPDELLDEVAPPDEQPDAVIVTRETISLAFLALIQQLPARQRAVLLMRDVLSFSAAETASLLEMSVASVTSALQRGRAKLADAGERRVSPPSPRERELLAGFIDAHERCDTAASIALMREDIRVTMPPMPYLFEGIDGVRPLMDDAWSMGEWRLVATAANRMPAAASYLRRPGDSLFRAMKLDVLRVDGGLVAEVTTFGTPAFPWFGLPETL
jgi:RNA polymerase sigma-70 factor (TIGR02960 family)